MQLFFFRWPCSSRRLNSPSIKFARRGSFLRPATVFPSRHTVLFASRVKILKRAAKCGRGPRPRGALTPWLPELHLHRIAIAPAVSIKGRDQVGLQPEQLDRKGAINVDEFLGHLATADGNDGRHA
jgi:hypothetical protein